MRKHFLILMLLSLLPLAGWAQTPVNLSGYGIKFVDPAVDNEFAYYSENAQKQAVDKKPAIVLYDGTNEIAEDDDKFVVVWTKNGETVTELKTVGEYVVTVTANGSDTYGTLAQPSRSFWVLRANNGVTNTPAVGAGGTYAAAPTAGYELVATKPTVNFGTVKYLVTETDAQPLATATEWSTTAPKSKKVGTHYVWFKVDGTENYKPIVPQKVGTGSVEITGDDLTEGTDYTAPTALAVAGIPFTNTDQNLLAAGATKNSDKVTAIKYSLNGTDWQDAIPTGKNVATYTVYWKAVATDGYYDKTGTVAAKIIAGNPVITTATKAADFTYKGVATALLSKAATSTLGATPVYSIKYSATDLDEAGWASQPEMAGGNKAFADVKGLDAGFYLVTPKVVATANYTDATGTPVKIQIKKATLTVTADAKEKVYGTAADPALTATYTGWQNNETAESQTTAGKFSAATWTRAVGTVVGEYAITKTGDATATNYDFVYDAENYGKFTITPKELNGTDFTFTLHDASLVYTGEDLTTTLDEAKFGVTDMSFPADYTYIITNNRNAGTANVIITGQGNFKGSVVKNFTITPKPVYIKPANASKKYGAEDPALTGYTLGNLTGAPLSFVADPDAVLKGTVELARVAGDNVGTYKIYVKGYTPAADDNYTIATDANSGAGKGQIVNDPADATAYNLLASFQVEPASSPLVLKLKDGSDNTKIYGDANPAWTINDLEYVSGAIGDDTWETIKPALSAPVFSIADENVGAENNKVLVSTYSTNYPVVTLQDYPFTVTPRPIAVIVKAQTVDYGTNIVKTYDTDDTYWEVDNANSHGTDWNGNQDTDGKAKLKLTMATHDPYLSYGPNGAVAKTYNGVIEATIDNPNYELTVAKCTWGNLTVNPGEYLVLSDEDADVFAKITAHNGQNKKVKIVLNRDQALKEGGKPRTWMKEMWNSIVLPFDISIAELSTKFGYAIFNVADAANTVTGKVAFKIEMAANYDGNIIPANTPLLIKTNTAIANATTIDFGMKEIVAPATAQFGEVINATGYKFKGTYAAMTVSAESEYADNFYFWTGTTNTPSRIQSTSTQGNTWIIKPFSAYVDQTGSTSARDMELEFTYEELGGGTTTVRGISIDEINNDKLNEGVFNLNGVKMNNVPTQKGIYIMNGKKVVVK